MDKTQFDVFISYKSDQKPWVLVLARNLTTAGFNVFFDEWYLIPGQSITDALYKGLNNSRKGILVVTPEAMESGWAKNEYFYMLNRHEQDSQFSVIPVLLCPEVTQVPFMKDILWIDFRDPAPTMYRDSFYKLCCALRGIPPGPKNHLTISIEYPEHPNVSSINFNTGEKTFIEEKVFESFYDRKAVLLLVQEDRWQSGIDKQLHAVAVERFGEKNVRHIIPPFGTHENLENYFSMIAARSGYTKEIKSSSQLRIAFEQTLSDGETLFLILSGFENSCEEGRYELAGILRSLNEMYPHSFKVLICGGEKLADMYFGGILSYLNHAGIIEWPDFSRDDIMCIVAHKKNPLLISIPDSEQLLRLSGGHPLLVDIGIELLRKNESGSFEEKFKEAVNQSPQVWQLFTSFMRLEPRLQKELGELLKREDVAPAQPYIHDPLLKILYWKNLLRRSPNQNRLVWRCDLLREIGFKILRIE